jgi:hypothetical protein
MDLVVMLGEQGKHVTLVTRRSGQYDLGDGPGVDMEPIHRYDLFMTRIPEYDLRIVSFSTYKQVTDSGLIVVDKAGKENLVEGGKVIFALGFSPNDQLVEALQNVVPQILTAGDTVEPRKVLYAVAEGLQAGRLC